MPSSVVFAALVLAWLVVLVPVVARRRQMVPRTAEADLSAKVLPRGASVDKVQEEVSVADGHPDRRSGAAGTAGTAVSASGHTGGATALAEHDVDELDRELELEAHDGDDDGPSHPGSRERVLDRGGDRVADDDRDDGWDEDWDGEPRTFRPGRGGFDPEAAEAAANQRYAYRQRVALGLIAVAVLSALAALVVTPALWWLHVLTDLALVGYLVFLRRQTRIEEELRARRAARLSGERRALAARRERQAAHDDLMAAHRREADAWSEWSDEEDVEEWEAEPEADDEVAAVPAPRWAAPRTPAPPVPDGMELVDDSDDDPAFHQLDGDRVPAYRRAAAGA